MKTSNNPYPLHWKRRTVDTEVSPGIGTTKCVKIITQRKPKSALYQKNETAIFTEPAQCTRLKIRYFCNPSCRKIAQIIFNLPRETLT